MLFPGAGSLLYSLLGVRVYNIDDDVVDDDDDDEIGVVVGVTDAES